MKVLLVEDDHALAEGLLYAIRKEGYEVLWAKSGESALELLKAEAISLVILDVRLPGSDGFSICRHMRGFSHVPILMLTAKDEEIDKVMGLAIGADDYVTKPFGLRELLGRINALARRAYEYGRRTPQIIRIHELELDPVRHHVRIRGSEARLTPTEFSILLRLAQQPGIVISREALIEAIWGIEGDYLTDQNVSVHIRRIREKIESDPSKPTYIITVRGFGYKMLEG